MGPLYQKTMWPSTFSACIPALVYLNTLFHITLCLVPVQIPKTVTQFTVSDSNRLEHIEVHKTTGDVYIGASNMIYKLDEDLNMQSQQNWLTAGIETTTQCPPDNDNCNSEMNNNKVLLIDYDNNFLLSCGSSRYGTCVLHGLDSVSNIEGRIMSNLANDSIAIGETVAAFFGDFREAGSPSSVLYVASTYEDNPPSTSIIQHAVASKRLSQSENGQWHLRLAYQYPAYGQFTYIDLRNDEVRRDFKIKYVYGFSVPGDPGFSYFLTVQKDDVDQRDYKSKIVRICQEDKGYISYTELTLRCKSYSETGGTENLRILQAAYLGKAGNHLINSMSGVASDDYILYALFSKSVNANTRETTSGSALCIYPISKINEKIQEGLQGCFYATQTRGLEHMERAEDVLDCMDIGYQQIRPDFCGTSQLHPIDTHKTITKTDMLRGAGNNDIFTSIIVKAEGDDTIAVIGTESGHLLKFLVQAEEEITPHAGIPYKNLLLDGPVLQDMAFDPTEEHVYAMTPETIYKFSLSTCDHYIECSACILTHDPNQCGWCGTGCELEDDCEQEGGSWVTQYCPPVIYEVKPLFAPLNSRVNVTLIGDNLGTSLGQGIHEFTVAGRPCASPTGDSKRIVCTVEPVPYQLVGPVVAHVEADSVDPAYRVNGTHSDFTFSFVESSIEGIKPAFGHLAGGTNVTISGVGLRSGNSLTVTVAGLPCLIQSSNNTALICTTTESADITSGIVELTIDGQSFQSTQEFGYKLLPTVKSYAPTESYFSGGRLIVVNGANLHVVEEPKIVVTIQKNNKPQSIEGMCNPADPPGSVMVCPSPNIAEHVLSQEPITGSVSFIFKGWYDMPVEEDPEMTYYADSIFNLLPSDVLVSKGSKLIITGTNLDVASNKSEINVTIRDKACEVEELTQTRLVCKVPPLDYTEEENIEGHPVMVTVSNNQFEIGSVMYIIPDVTHNVTAVVISLIFLFVAILVAFLLFWVVRNKQKKDRAGSVSEQAVRMAYARTISTSGSQHSGTQFSGESRVEPPMVRNTYLRNPSAESHVEEEARPLLQQIGNDLAAQVGEVLILERNLKLGDTIGQGHFGCVYEGMFIQDGEDLHVAVKSLLHGATNDIANFLREGIMMKDFKHQNVLRLIGVCIKDDRIPLVVLPFMKHGDLLTYIRNPQNELTARQLLEFSRGIADGMAYLASLKFVHRDLAARNCMLDEEFGVKVADFGLSRDIYERDYYSAKDKTAKLPVRWMALECLERNIYNTKTDVWSYGIVIWELMTRGVTPYPSVDNCDLSAFLQRGRRLPQPPHCPDNVYDVMNSCWLVSPVDRPTFNLLVSRLDDILNSEEDAAGFDKDEVYINVPHY